MNSIKYLSRQTCYYYDDDDDVRYGVHWPWKANSLSF